MGSGCRLAANGTSRSVTAQAARPRLKAVAAARTAKPLGDIG
jgi:hypothetical protein